LPDLSTLPILSHTGEHLPQGQVSLNQAALLYSEGFGKEFGGCTEGSDGKEGRGLVRPKRKPWSADDLFCLEEGRAEERLVGMEQAAGAEEGDLGGQDVKDDTDTA
jgi:hypothetical protein